MTAWLPSVRLATTENLIADGSGRPFTPAALDGVAVEVNNHILVKDQTDPIQNGTWIAGAIPGVPMLRRKDIFEPESTVRVSEGGRNAHTAWALKALASAITVDTDPLPWLRQDVKNYSLDNIAALKGFSGGMLVGATASVAGYYKAGDQGGGNFTFIGVPESARITGAKPVSVTIDTVSVMNGIVTVTTTRDHGLGGLTNPPTVGSVWLSGALAPTLLEGAWLVNVRDHQSFTLRGLVFDTLTTPLPHSAFVSYVAITTADKHLRNPGQRVVVAGVDASGGAADLNTLSGPGGVLNDKMLSLAIDATAGGMYTCRPSAVLGDDALFVTATDDAGTMGGVWRRTQEAGVFNVRAFGATADGTTDDGPAINAAVFAAAAISGYQIEQPAGIVHFPGGRYNCSRQLAFESVTNVVWRGPAQLNFDADGSSPFLSLLSVAQFTFTDLFFTYDNADYNGPLIITWIGASGADANSFRWDRCTFRGDNPQNEGLPAKGASHLLFLPYSENSCVKDCTFTAAQTGLRGRIDLNNGFSNNVLVDRCSFNKLWVSSIHNASEAWTILNCTFEPLTDGRGNELSKNAYTQELTYFALAFNFIGNWCGDGDLTGPWVTGKFLGANISGNIIAGSGGIDTGALVIAGSLGVAITGNRFSGSIQFVKDDVHRPGPGNPNAGIALFGNSVQSDIPYLGTTDCVSGALTRVGNDDMLGEDQVNLPLRLSKDGTVYGHVILGMANWDAFSLTPFATSDDPLSWFKEFELSITGALLGDAVSVGISPALPPGTVATVAMIVDGTARVTVQNLNAAALPRHNIDIMASTIRVHALRSPPDVFSIDHRWGAPEGGDTVVVTGRGFQVDATVTFGEAAATVVWNKSSQLTCITPAHKPGLLPWSVVVTNPDGAGGETSRGTGARLYAYWPCLSGVSPTHGPNMVATSVEVHGAGFLVGATVTFDGNAATSIIVVSPTTITCDTPALIAGKVAVVVTNPDSATSTTSGADLYTYDP